MDKKEINREMIQQLYKAILDLNNEEECAEFFDDLCTYKEVEQMAQRLKAAELLYEGNTYNQVTSEIDISSATLSRVSRALQYGKGYRKYLNTKEKK